MYTWLTYTTHFLPSIRSSFVFDDTHTPRFSFHLFQFLLPDESFAKARVFHVVLRCMESERERDGGFTGGLFRAVEERSVSIA